MFDFLVILSMKNSDEILFRESADDKEAFTAYLMDKISKSDYMIISEDVDGDTVWIKDTEDIQHVVIKNIKYD